MKNLLDLKLFGLVAILTVALVFISVGFIEGQVKTLGKPDKPGESKTEWIAFDGDLVGGQAVEGCCPNAGPWPEYAMTLSFEVGDFQSDTYYGQLFINYYGAGRNQKYIVQFWNDTTGIGIEIIGGVIVEDRKNKVTTVTFTNEMCVDLWSGTPIKVVNFTLVKRPY